MAASVGAGRASRRCWHVATFDGAGRKMGAPHDLGGDAQRRERVQVSAKQLTEIADLIRSNLLEYRFGSSVGRRQAWCGYQPAAA